MKTIVRVSSVAVGLVLGLGLSGPASAEDPANKALFTQYCGSCHGPDGTGNGVMSGFLKTKPADLTQIAKKNGGKFPMNETIQFIDGTKDVRAHGNPDMPVWGEVFKAQTKDSPRQQAEIRGKILMIADYVSTIQAK
ncbi:MAG: cytochrome c [Deltaproteobacteria bacterium]|nr:cytochrome c [Deltaproteobacteria bacterium]